MLRLSYGGVYIALKDYAGVLVEHRGEALCIDVVQPTCPHIFYSHERHYGGYAGNFYAPFTGNVKVGETVRTGPFVVRPVEAYNITKLRDGKPIHSKGEGVGYVVEISGATIYHMGDTDLIQALTAVGRPDILLVPTGGDGVMTPEEAADAVKLLRPKIAVPIHFNEVKLYVKFRDIAQPYTQVVNLKQRAVL